MLTYVMGGPTAWLERRHRHPTPRDAFLDATCDYKDRVLFVYEKDGLLGVFDLTEMCYDLGALESFNERVFDLIKDKIK